MRKKLGLLLCVNMIFRHALLSARTAGSSSSRRRSLGVTVRLVRGYRREISTIELSQKVRGTLVETWDKLKKAPRLNALQQLGACIVLYSYSETDVTLLRFWAVSGIMCYSLIPNAYYGNTLLTAWAMVFLGMNGVRLAELVREQAPVQLTDDERIAYEFGINKFVSSSCFKRLAANAETRNERGGAALGNDHDVYIVLSGTVEISTYGTQDSVKGPGDIVGDIPTLIDDVEEEAAKVTMTVGQGGARLLKWKVSELKSTISEEKDPNTEMQIIRYFYKTKMKAEQGRYRRAVLKRYALLLQASIPPTSDAQLKSDDKAALLEFRRSHSISRQEHEALLAELGWTLVEWQLGTKVNKERTSAALASLSQRVRVLGAPPPPSFRDDDNSNNAVDADGEDRKSATTTANAREDWTKDKWQEHNRRRIVLDPTSKKQAIAEKVVLAPSSAAKKASEQPSLAATKPAKKRKTKLKQLSSQLSVSGKHDFASKYHLYRNKSVTGKTVNNKNALHLPSLIEELTNAHQLSVGKQVASKQEHIPRTKSEGKFKEKLLSIFHPVDHPEPPTTTTAPATPSPRIRRGNLEQPWLRRPPLTTSHSTIVASSRIAQLAIPHMRQRSRSE